MLSKGQKICKIVKRPPGNESISFCFIVVHTRQFLKACQKRSQIQSESKVFHHFVTDDLRIKPCSNDHQLLHSS